MQYRILIFPKSNVIIILVSSMETGQSKGKVVGYTLLKGGDAMTIFEIIAAAMSAVSYDMRVSSHVIDKVLFALKTLKKRKTAP